MISFKIYFKKFILSSIACIITINSFSQSRKFYGKVVDVNKKGIPFVLVQLKDKNQGFYCNENGGFAFNLNMDTVKTIVFYCIGYKKHEINVAALSKDSIVIELEEENVNLKEVIVTDKGDKKRIRHGILGKKNINNKVQGERGAAYGSLGYEDAIFLKADSNRNGVFEKIFVYVTDEGMPTSKFRVHVYNQDNIDPKTTMPGEDIIDSNVIVQANKGNEWVKVDLSSRRIPIKSGVFISVEWIGGNAEWKTKYGGRAYGQVMGVTEGYWKRGFITVGRTAFDRQWVVDAHPVFSKKNLLNYMIYATYTYR